MFFLKMVKKQTCDYCSDEWEYKIQKEGLIVKLCESCFNSLEN